MIAGSFKITPAITRVQRGRLVASMPDDHSSAVAKLASAASPKLAEQGPAIPLRRLAVRGAIWTILGFGFSQILRLGFNLIVTRMLYPELFGLLALVNTF